MSRCSICGKICKSEAGVKQHQREADSCRLTAGSSDSQLVKQLDEKLQRVIEAGRSLGLGSGSFEETQRNNAEREELEAALRNARCESKNEGKRIKELACKSMDTSNWTKALLDGDQRFSKSEELLEARLAQETVGLVSTTAFREKRENLEKEDCEKHKRERENLEKEAAALKEQRKARKKQHEKQQRRGLSFDEIDDICEV
mmetsp:Transcript_5874/g.9856  ORF Transcript_5874/g.9856 Transcript_5874/m.9856 type:complete len:202 (+) Transcript_5874:286-891(+)|eukprot:CAMPEP_0119336420 /NCGR_PEP_ID=MMETSP1333-20130426/91773_1 /TAXON_ID=418940 /ORGANISM="Scyphosphaera apsteinii, Strain RCC1455" /LENGTH=201 /DNA_ID=CAMNT_0007347221 /DNA_START=283 /DNA_END=888 /DNA_ORIENTATION=+